MNRKGILPLKRVVSIIVVSVLAVGLGAASWLLTSLPSFHLEKRVPTSARIQAPDFTSSLTATGAFQASNISSLL